MKLGLGRFCDFAGANAAKSSFRRVRTPSCSLPLVLRQTIENTLLIGLVLHFGCSSRVCWIGHSDRRSPFRVRVVTFLTVNPLGTLGQVAKSAYPTQENCHPIIRRF